MLRDLCFAMICKLVVDDQCTVFGGSVRDWVSAAKEYNDIDIMLDKEACKDDMSQLIDSWRLALQTILDLKDTSYAELEMTSLNYEMTVLSGELLLEVDDTLSLSISIDIVDGNNCYLDALRHRPCTLGSALYRDNRGIYMFDTLDKVPLVSVNCLVQKMRECNDDVELLRTIHEWEIFFVHQPMDHCLLDLLRHSIRIHRLHKEGYELANFTFEDVATIYPCLTTCNFLSAEEYITKHLRSLRSSCCSGNGDVMLNVASDIEGGLYHFALQLVNTGKIKLSDLHEIQIEKPTLYSGLSESGRCMFWIVMLCAKHPDSAQAEWSISNFDTSGHLYGNAIEILLLAQQMGVGWLFSKPNSIPTRLFTWTAPLCAANGLYSRLLTFKEDMLVADNSGRTAPLEAAINGHASCAHLWAADSVRKPSFAAAWISKSMVYAAAAHGQLELALDLWDNGTQMKARSDKVAVVTAFSCAGLPMSCVECQHDLSSSAFDRLVPLFMKLLEGHACSRTTCDITEALVAHYRNICDHQFETQDVHLTTMLVKLNVLPITAAHDLLWKIGSKFEVDRDESWLKLVGELLSAMDAKFQSTPHVQSFARQLFSQVQQKGGTSEDDSEVGKGKAKGKGKGSDPGRERERTRKARRGKGKGQGKGIKQPGRQRGDDNGNNSYLSKDTSTQLWKIITECRDAKMSSFIYRFGSCKASAEFLKTIYRFHQASSSCLMSNPPFEFLKREQLQSYKRELLQRIAEITVNTPDGAMTAKWDSSSSRVVLIDNTKDTSPTWGGKGKGKGKGKGTVIFMLPEDFCDDVTQMVFKECDSRCDLACVQLCYLSVCYHTAVCCHCCGLL